MAFKNKSITPFVTVYEEYYSETLKTAIDTDSERSHEISLRAIENVFAKSRYYYHIYSDYSSPLT